MSNPDNKWLLGLSNELLLLVLKFVTPNEIMIQWGPSADSSGASEAMSYRAARHPNAKMVFIPRRYRAPVFKISYTSDSIRDLLAFSRTCQRMNKVVHMMSITIQGNLRVYHPYDRDHTQTCLCSDALMRDLSKQPILIRNAIRCLRISMTNSAPSLLDILFRRRIWEKLPRVDRFRVERSQDRPNIVYVTRSQAEEIRNRIQENATTYRFQSDGILLAIDSLSSDVTHARTRQQDMQKEITRRQLTFEMSDCVLVLYPGDGTPVDFELPSDRDRIVSVETTFIWEKDSNLSYTQLKAAPGYTEVLQRTT